MGRSRGPLADEDGAWFGHRRASECTGHFVCECDMNSQFPTSKRRRIAVGLDNLDPGSTGDGKRPPLYHCNYCHKDISGTIRMKCAECTDYDLCVECFSVGAETFPHKSNHPYRVMDNLAFPLIHPDWNADEEILLLEAVEMCGVGNWGDVAEHVGTKTKHQCADHYTTAYMNSPFSPLPDLTHVMGKSKAELMAMGRLHLEGKKSSAGAGDPLRLVKQEPTMSPARIKTEDVKELAEGRSPSSLLLGSKDGKLEDQADGSSGVPMGTAKKTAVTGQARENLDTQGTPKAVEEGQGNRSIGGKKLKPLVCEDSKSGVITLDTGYNPKRQEFDPEYDSGAEKYWADMEFKDSDTETDRELKLRILHIYLSRLNERKWRKDFVIERGLIDLKKQAALDKKRTKEERELYLRTRPFLRFHSNEEHDSLLNGLNSERRLRQRIEELQEMQLAGCRTLADGEIYLVEKKKREIEANVKKARETSGFIHSGAKATHRFNRSLKRDLGDVEPSPAGAGAGEARSNQKLRSGGGHHTLTSTALGKGSKKSATLPDLAGYPGMEMLSLAEQELCQQWRLIPSHYLKMKEVLVFEGMRNGPVRRSDAYGMFKVDPIKTDKVYELLMRMGWIQGDSPVVDRKVEIM